MLSLKHFFSAESKQLRIAADRASRLARGENHKEAAAERREVNLSYDDLDREDSEEFVKFGPVVSFIVSGAGIIFLIIGGLKLIEIWQRKQF